MLSGSIQKLNLNEKLFALIQKRLVHIPFHTGVQLKNISDCDRSVWRPEIYKHLLCPLNPKELLEQLNL